MKKIYIADDEKNIRALIRPFLEREGFNVSDFEDGKALLEAFTASPADMLIIDIMMPGIDGLSLCNTIRQCSAVPIIIVSAKDSEFDRVMGITIGSDDYLVKPFSPLELVARVKALFRRNEMLQNKDMSEKKLMLFHGLTLNANLRTADLNGEELLLTPTEFDFLVYLVRNQDRAISKTELLQELWQFDFEAETRVTDDLVKRLRKKLQKTNLLAIETVWGFGYRIKWRGEPCEN